MKSSTKTSRNPSKVFIILAVSVVAILIGAGISYALINNQKSSNSTETTQPATPDTTNTINNEQSTQEQVEAGTIIKEQSSSQSAGTNSNQNNTLTVSATAFENSATNIRVVVNISQNIDQGTCVVTISNNTLSKSYSADVQFSGTYSTCKGFDIPKSDLGSNPSGNWDIKLNVTSGSKQGEATTSIKIT